MPQGRNAKPIREVTSTAHGNSELAMLSVALKVSKWHIHLLVGNGRVIRKHTKAVTK
jgi:hypothetical protein